MAQLHGIDLSDVEQSTPQFANKCVPKGQYMCEIAQADYVSTSRGGNMIKLTMVIQNGEHQGRWIKDNLNVVNANPKAEEVAKQRLKEITTALGLPDKGLDTDWFIGQHLMVHTKVNQIADMAAREKWGDDDGNQTSVSRYKGLGQAAAQRGGAPSQQAAAPATNQAPHFEDVGAPDWA